MDVFLQVVGPLLWKTRNTTQMRRLCHLSHPSPNSPLLSLFIPPPSLFPLREIMRLFDLRRDVWQWFAKSSPVSITLRVKYQPWVSVSVGVCVSIGVCMCPVSPIMPLGSVTLWQRALIFQFYHTPLSQLPPLALFLIILTLFFFFFPSHRPVPNAHTHTSTRAQTHT